MLRVPLVRLLLAALLLPVAALAQDGTLDPTFGDDGVVVTGVGATSVHTARAVAVQEDGKFVVTGMARGSSSSFSRFRIALARLNADGSLDLSFGEGGRVLIDEVGEGQAHDVTVQADGKILVAGLATDEEYGGFALFRFTPDGDLDPTFGEGGRVLTTIGELTSLARAVALQADGRILVAGRSDLLSGFGSAIALARYDSDGSLDPSFGEGGIVLKRIGTDTGTRYDDAFDVALDPEERIVVTGSHESPDDRTSFFLLRYDASGALDASFGDGGVATTAFGTGNARAHAVALLPDGRIATTGFADGASGRAFALARYLPNGALDPSFGTGGTTVTPLSEGTDAASSIIVLPSGRLLVAGTAEPEGTSAFALARYESNGSLDASFGDGGTVVTPNAGSNAMKMGDAVLLSNGQVAAVGSSTRPNTLALARYEAHGALDVGFGIEGIAMVGDFRPGADYARDVGLQADGRFVVLGVAESSSAALATLSRFTPDGSLDPTFGEGGHVVAPYAPNDYSSIRYGPRSVSTLQGSIVIAGHTPEATGTGDDDGPRDLFVARFHDDGSLDTGFGGGIITTDLGADEVGSTVLAQNDGKVLVVGGTGDYLSPSPSGDVVLVRYTSSGELDSDFGEGGVAVSDEADFEGAEAASLQRDGKILITGIRYDDPGPLEAFFTRLLPDGSLDVGFGAGGTVVVEPPDGLPLLIPAEMALLPDGRIVSVGTVALGSGSSRLCLIGLSADGTLEWIRLEEAVLMGTDLTIDPEGRIIAAGIGIGSIVTARYTPDGTPDATYGDGGIAEVDSNGVGGSVVVIAHPEDRIIAATTVWNRTHTDIGLAAFRSGETVGAESSAPSDGAPRVTVWPNPARSTATISIFLDLSRDVRVEAFDVLGRRIAVLHDGPLTAGPHEFMLAGRGFPAGVYIVRVAGEELALTRRLTIVR